jgi:mutator protein MutT
VPMEHPLSLFKYCPKCGSNRFEIKNNKAKQCADCGFVYYFNPSSATVALILNRENELLVCRRAKDPQKGKLDLPGGFIDCNETGEEGVAREVKEETGLKVMNASYLFSLPNIYPYSGFTVQTLDMFYRCEVENTNLISAMDDVSACFFVPLQDVHPEQFGLLSIRRGLAKFLKLILVSMLFLLPITMNAQVLKPISHLSTQESSYKKVCEAYDLSKQNCISLLRDYLERYPDTQHANRIYSLMASSYYKDGSYIEAISLFNKVDLNKLIDKERDSRTYELAVCYLKTNRLKEAAIWFETLRISSPTYHNAATYYLSYIRYNQQRYDEALQGFESLKTDPDYEKLVPYYMGEIYLLQKKYESAYDISTSFLNHYNNDTHAIEMKRIKGEAAYRLKRYNEAAVSLEDYLNNTQSPRRDAMYMLGLSYYLTRVYSKSVDVLNKVTKGNDEVTQNAYLHIGLSYLQLSDKNKARMAFEQAANMNTNVSVKEEAAYNYAVCIYETSFSAFGESVTAFERFLNEFPHSQYADKVNSYLIEMYMKTRNYEEALQSIERISQPARTIMEAKQHILFQLGNQSFVNSNFNKAVEYFNRSIALGEYNQNIKSEALYWRGESYYRLDEMNKAASDYRSYLQQTEQKSGDMYSLAYYNLGYISFHQQKYDESLSYFMKFVGLKNDNKDALADSYNRIGDCYFYSRSFNEALSYYKLAGDANHASSDYALYQQALVKGIQKQYGEKISILNNLVQHYPSSPYIVNALFEQGRAYVQLGNNQSAIRSYQELIAKYPQNALALKASSEMALLYYQDGNYDKAVSTYKQIAVQYKGSEEARMAMRDLKSIYVEQNKVDEYAALASEMPENVKFDVAEQDSLTYLAAERIYQKGNDNNSIESLSNYVQKYPNGAFMEQALTLLSQLQYNQKRYADANTSYKALKDRTSDPESRLQAKLGVLRCSVKEGENEEVIQAASDLLTEPKLVDDVKNEVLYERASAYLRLNESAQALPDLQVLAKDTRNLYGAEAKYRIGQLYFDQKDYANAEKEILDFINQSTPHAYWLARGFILLSDIYVVTNRKSDARQYLLSLRQNYHAKDDILSMVTERLKKIDKE